MDGGGYYIPHLWNFEKEFAVVVQYVEMGREDIEDKASAYTWAMLVLRKDGMGSVLYYFRPFHFKCVKGSVITKLGLLNLQ